MVYMVVVLVVVAAGVREWQHAKRRKADAAALREMTQDRDEQRRLADSTAHLRAEADDQIVKARNARGRYEQSTVQWRQYAARCRMAINACLERYAPGDETIRGNLERVLREPSVESES